MKKFQKKLIALGGITLAIANVYFPPIGTLLILILIFYLFYFIRVEEQKEGSKRSVRSTPHKSLQEAIEKAREDIKKTKLKDLKNK